MASKYLPKKLYYLKESSGEYYGPYTKKPTQMCNADDEIISWEIDKDGNYLIQSLKVIRKNKLKQIANKI